MSSESKLLFGVIASGVITAHLLTLWFESSIFFQPRKWLEEFLRTKISTFLAKLISCPLCLSHWINPVSLFLSADFIGCKNPYSNGFEFWFVYWILSLCVANTIYYKIFYSEDPIVDPLINPNIDGH